MGKEAIREELIRKSYENSPRVIISIGIALFLIAILRLFENTPAFLVILSIAFFLMGYALFLIIRDLIEYIKKEGWYNLTQNIERIEKMKNVREGKRNERKD